jgi:site-specific recombinase XerD
MTAETMADAISAFLLSREVANASPATLKTYGADLSRFSRAIGAGALAIAPEVLQHHFVTLRAQMKPISVHRAYRTLRTFCRWCVRTGRFTIDPMHGMTMRLPKTLPRVPNDEDVRQLLAACPNTPEGLRNRVLVALAADSGLRKEELRRLRIEDLDLAAHFITVRCGKSAKDGVTFYGEVTASLLRAWLAVHPDPRPAAFLLVTREGVLLGPWAIVRILHRLSRRAGLHRPIGPHALRHYAATALLRRTADLELVRRVLRHETLTMALRYVVLAQAEIAVKFSHASPLDHLRAQGRGAKPATSRPFCDAGHGGTPRSLRVLWPLLPHDTGSRQDVLAAVPALLVASSSPRLAPERQLPSLSSAVLPTPGQRRLLLFSLPTMGLAVAPIACAVHLEAPCPGLTSGTVTR